MSYLTHEPATPGIATAHAEPTPIFAERWLAGNGTAKRKNRAEEGAAEEERVLWWVFEFFRAFSSLRKKRDETSEGGFDGLVDWLIRSA